MQKSLVVVSVALETYAVSFYANVSGRRAWNSGNVPAACAVIKLSWNAIFSVHLCNGDFLGAHKPQELP